MLDIEMQEVSSSNISAIGYDVEEMILRIEFNTGRTYDYEDVPEYVYENLENADSIGSYFYKHIRNNYEGKEITEELEEDDE